MNVDMPGCKLLFTSTMVSVPDGQEAKIADLAALDRNRCQQVLSILTMFYVSDQLADRWLTI